MRYFPPSTDGRVCDGSVLVPCEFEPSCHKKGLCGPRIVCVAPCIRPEIPNSFLPLRLAAVRRSAESGHQFERDLLNNARSDTLRFRPALSVTRNAHTIAGTIAQSRRLKTPLLPAPAARDADRRARRARHRGLPTSSSGRAAPMRRRHRRDSAAAARCRRRRAPQLAGCRYRPSEGRSPGRRRQP
jgi:hypothetical protein